MGDSVVLEKAHVLCYRIFDIGDEIHLERARAALAKDTRRLRLSREGSQYLQLPNPPLTAQLGKKTLALRAGPVEVSAKARLFDHGAGSIILQVPVVPGTTLEQLVPLADELYDSPAVEALSQELIVGLQRELASTVENAHLWEQNESYTVLFAEQIEGNPSAAQLLERLDLARLLLGETGQARLSSRERFEVTQHAFSYTEHDLAVVDWNSAFVYEPSGSPDIPDVLEICNAQLLEFRYYDHLLDRSIQTVHQEMLQKKRGWTSLLRSPYRLLARRVLVTLMEMSEFTERVENSLKIIADFYLAKVYEAAVKRLRVSLWQASVTRKQQMLANVYQLLKGEVDTDRALTLEAAIVLLILLDIFLALAKVF
jgi:hypothetical protein